MKGFSSFLTLGLLLAAMVVASPRAGAQQFGLSVTSPSDSILVGNSLTYTINVTNLNVGTIDAVVTNFLPASAQFQSATSGYTQVSSNVIVFGPSQFLSGNSVQLTVTAIPTVVGSITDTVVVASTDPGFTNTVSTNVVVNVTNVVIQADLGVTMTGTNQTVFTNDWMTFSVIVTNSGPSTAPNVILTNILPPGVISISPRTNQAVGTNITFTFPLGTLTNGGSTTVQFTVQPTAVTNLLFFTSVGSGVPDTNTINNTNSIYVTITNYFPGSLTAGIITNQVYNPQNGLVEQFVAVTNVGTNAVNAVRVVVTGLTNSFLANAVGTNAGNPFVVFAAALDSNQSVNLLMQYYTPTRSAFSFSNSQLNPFPVFVPNLTPPTITAVSTNLNIYRVLMLTNGNVLLEWQTVTNRTYTVVYSDNVSFSNAMIAPPSITALGTRLQWVDYGPPTTISLPTNTARFYRVFQNP